ncbi:MAG: NAD(P)H-binding protein [Candidatus Obscuribacterales bacterium]|nr:NAD(P)H-binding protein [Candidatus Obscuribacterales bacterium]
MTAPERKLIAAVDGATGYVGNHLVWALAKNGYQVRAIVHPKAKESDCRFLQTCGAEIFRTDLKSDSEILKKALNSADCAFHLIGSIAPPKGQKLEDLHAGQTKELLAACRESKTKVMLLTALGSRGDAQSDYHKTKWQSEELLRNSGLEYLILQPSLIVGKQVGNRNSKLMTRYVHLIRTRPRVPLIAGGSVSLQPVFIGDLTEAIIKASFDPKYSGKTLELGGPEIINMKELVSKLMQLLRINKPLIAVPTAVASLAASFLEIFQTVPLLSRDQVKLSASDNYCKSNALSELLGHSPTSLDAALSTYGDFKEI